MTPKQDIEAETRRFQETLVAYLYEADFDKKKQDRLAKAGFYQRQQLTEYRHARRWPTIPLLIRILTALDLRLEIHRR